MINKWIVLGCLLGAFGIALLTLPSVSVGLTGFGEGLLGLRAETSQMASETTQYNSTSTLDHAAHPRSFVGLAVKSQVSEADVPEDDSVEGLTEAEATNAIYATLAAALVASLLIAFTYDVVLGNRPVTRARKYAAWTSTTVLPSYMTLLNDIFLGRFDDATIGRVIGLGLWACIFSTAAYFIGKSRDRSVIKSANDQFSVSVQSPLSAQTVAPTTGSVNIKDRIAFSLDVNKLTIEPEILKNKSNKYVINAEQKTIIIVALVVVSAILFFSFIRIGSSLDYRNSFILLHIADVDHPRIFGSSSAKWGVIARAGLGGVIFGLVLPVILISTALFIRRANPS